MKYEELDTLGKIWYFVILLLVVLLILFLTLIVGAFILLVKIIKFVKLGDAIGAWGQVIANGFTKKFKNAKKS